MNEEEKQKREDLKRLLLSVIHILNLEKEIFHCLEKKVYPYEFEHRRVM